MIVTVLKRRGAGMAARTARALRRLWGEQHGATAVVAALLATSMVGASGLAVDVSGWYSTKHALQAAADAAASGGALELYAGGTQAQAQAAAASDGQLNANGLASGATITSSVGSQQINGASAQTVTATVSKPASLFFTGLFLSKTPTITVSATDGVSTSGPVLTALVNGGNSGTGALTVSSSSTLSSPSGAVIDNSGTNSGGGTVSSAVYCGPNGTKNASQGQQHQCAAVTDSLGSSPPTPSTTCYGHYGDHGYGYNGHSSGCYAGGYSQSCDYSNASYSSGSHTLSAGEYCGGITASGTATVTLNPGVYVLYGGGLTSSGSATINNNTSGGDGSGGVSIFVTGISSSSSTEPVDLESSGGTKLSAPTSGSMAGVAVSVDNNSSMCSGHAMSNTLGGSGSVDISGVEYYGSHSVSITGSSEQNKTAQYTMVEAGSISVSNTSTVHLTAYTSSSTVPLPSGYTFTTPQIVKIQ